MNLVEKRLMVFITNKLPIITSTVLALGSFFLGCEAQAVTFSFKRIVDTNTAIPNGFGDFISFINPSVNRAPLLDGENIVFRGVSPDRQVGIYSYFDGLVDVVADSNTIIPDSTGKTENFSYFGDFSLDGKNVAFQGSNLRHQQGGIYTYIGGAINVVADINTLIPGTSSTFSGFLLYGTPFFKDGYVVFHGSDYYDNYNGLYTNSGGSLNVLVDSKTPLPEGRGNFTILQFDSPSLDNVAIAFEGQNSSFEPSVYTLINGLLEVVADTNTLIPGGTSNFTSFTSILLDNENVAFIGEGRGDLGIYTNIGGSLNVIANRRSLIPGKTLNFSGFDRETLSFDNDNVGFIGYGSDLFDRGIYTNIGGSLTKVIDMNDLIDGKAISNLFFGREGLSGDSLVFTAAFTDGSQAIYRADAIPDSPKSVPEPSTTIGILSLGLFGASSLLKRKQK